jgi:hypothetical protein
MGLHLALWNQFRKVAVYRTPIDPQIRQYEPYLNNLTGSSATVDRHRVVN